jgi:hypothetical protein
LCPNVACISVLSTLSRLVPQCCLYLFIVHSLLRLRFYLPYISNVNLPFAHVKKIAIQVLHLSNYLSSEMFKVLRISSDFGILCWSRNHSESYQA